MSAHLEYAGLIANMVGTLMAFFFGYPQPSHDEGVAILVEDGTPLPDGRTAAQHDADVRKQKALYTILSRLGLAVMFVGFGLQFLALYLK